MSAKVRGEFVSRNVVSKKWTFLLWIACFCLGMFFTNRMWVVPEANGSPRTSRKENEVPLFKSVSCNTKILVQHEGSNSSTQLSGTQDPLRILDRTISNLEMKLMEARTERESVMKGNALSSNSRIKELTRKKKYFMVIGINTAFSSRKRRDSIRATWMPQGEERKKLEERKGVVIRFVIGHRYELRYRECLHKKYFYTTSGGILDKTIDAEEKTHGDFMRLEHVEGYLELSAKTKTYFITAMSLWDAEFYVKVDDDVHVNLATLGMTLARHRKRPRIYVGCMKSGPVLARNGVKYHEPEYWKFGEVGNKYFRHATGQLYAISKDLVAYISVNQDVLHKYANEDVSLGSWLIGLDVEHVDDRRMCCGTPPDCEWKAQAGNVCVASFDWKCSGICRSVERMADVHERCGEEKNALWSREFSEVTSGSS